MCNSPAVHFSHHYTTILYLTFAHVLAMHIWQRQSASCLSCLLWTLETFYTPGICCVPACLFLCTDRPFIIYATQGIRHSFGMQSCFSSIMQMTSSIHDTMEFPPGPIMRESMTFIMSCCHGYLPWIQLRAIFLYETAFITMPVLPWGKCSFVIENICKYFAGKYWSHILWKHQFMWFTWSVSYPVYLLISRSKVTWVKDK